jgi:ParB family chromosome partitioning protein
MAVKKNGLGGSKILVAKRPATPVDTGASATTANPPPSSDSDGIGPKRGIVAALSAGGYMNQIPLADIAESPDNPRESLGDLEDFVASIKSVGILQPLVLTATDIYLKAHPQHRDAVSDYPFVILAGHRRRAAAALAELHEVPAVFREDLAGAQESAETFLHENLTRRDLTPLEEAAGYQLLIDLKLSQREIAQRLGRSQSHISKRVALLTLPGRLQDAVRSGELTVVNAVVLAGLPNEDQETVHDLAQNRGLSIEQAARHLKRDRESVQAASQANEQARREGITVVDPASEFGNSATQHRLYSEAEIDNARSEGQLVAAATVRGLEYYTRGSDDESLADDKRADRERRAASKRRVEAATKLVKGVPGAQALREELARGLLDGIDYTNALKLAHRWLGDTLGERHPDPHVWRDSITEPAQISHAAWALTIANAELGTKAAHSDWTAQNIAWVQRLQNEGGYIPTEWEKQQIAIGDSAGITPQPEATEEPE